MLRRSSIAVIVFMLFCLTRCGEAVPLGPVTEGQPPVTLRLVDGSQTAVEIKLAGARNEHLFLPITLAGGFDHLKATAEALPQGLKCQFFRVASAPSTQAGNFQPDALLPLEDDSLGPDADPFHFWICFKIAPDCLPGLHRLHLVIAHQRGSIRLPVDLRVYRFALPEDLPISIFGGFWPYPDLWRQYAKGQPQAEVAILQKYYQSLREHKFNALGGSYPLPLDRLQPGQRVEDFPPYHELLQYALQGLKFKYFQIPKLNGWKSANSPEDTFSQAAHRFYPLYTDYLRRQGWENRGLNYLVDEPRPQDYEAAVRSFALAKSLSPGIRTLSAGKQPPPGSAGAVDIWAYQAGSYRQDVKEQAQRQGQEAWLYANRLQGIDHPLAHQRLIGWLLYRYQFSGYLLWGVNYWPQDPWKTPPGPQDFFRRGTFYYPHPQTGLPVPTTRLEALRRGFQDYQYLDLLSQACQRGLIPRERQQLIVARVQRLTENLPRNPFPVSMAELEALRLQIGELLDGVMGN